MDVIYGCALAAFLTSPCSPEVARTANLRHVAGSNMAASPSSASLRHNGRARICAALAR
jgi:hypothetical protein